MKIEPRGKYPGVKVHLDKPETEIVLGSLTSLEFYGFVVKLQKKIQALQLEHPTLLEERTEEEIKAELELELKKSQEKLSKMAEGGKWNE